MEHLASKQKILIMISIMAAMFFAAINMTIVATSLPKIISHIGGMQYFEWVFTIYMLTSTITAMLVGKLSDIYGRKIFILIGIGLFMVGAFLSGTSDNIYQLIAYRGLQGFGGGMIMSCAFTTIGDLFSPRERGRWQGLMAGAFGLSSLFGPTLGGYLVDHYDWHWVFWIFLPIGFIAFALIWRLYPKPERKEKEPVDFLGSILLTMIITSLLLGFSWGGGKFAWFSWEIIALFSLTIGSILLFILVESNVKSPSLPLFLFKNKIFLVSNTAGLLLGMGMFGCIMYIPFYVQGVLGHSATTSGLVEMVMTLAMVTASTTVGFLITRTGKYKMKALVGLAIMGTGLFLNYTLEVDTTMVRLLVQLLIIGIGLGMTMPVFQLTVQNAVEHKYLGVATSAMQTFRQIGGTIGVALMGSVMANLMEKKIAEMVADVPPEEMPESSAEIEQLQNPQILMNNDELIHIRANLPEEITDVFDSFIQLLKEALNFSLTGVFLFSGIIIVAAFIVTFFLKEIPLRKTNE